MTSWYHRKLTKLEYNPAVFTDIIEFGKTSQWIEGYDANKILWNINELNLSTEDFPILEEIYSAVNLEFKKKRFYLSSVPPGGLNNHIDHKKWGNLGFPLVGNFTESPQYYYDQFNHPVESFILDSPVLFNTRMLHGVPRSIVSKTSRWILMLEIYEWVDNVFDRIDKDVFWNDTKHFKWVK